jgi:hypothetical protein
MKKLLYGAKRFAIIVPQLGPGLRRGSKEEEEEAEEEEAERRLAPLCTARRFSPRSAAAEMDRPRRNRYISGSIGGGRP